MRVKSKKSGERRRGTAEETGSGKDLGNFTGFANSRITAHFHAARAGYSTATYDPISASADAGRPRRQAPARTSETLQGSQILELQLISTLRGRGIQPRPTIPSRLSFPTGFSSGYRGLRNTGFVRGTRSEITRRMEKGPVLIRSMTA